MATDPPAWQYVFGAAVFLIAGLSLVVGSVVSRGSAGFAFPTALSIAVGAGLLAVALYFAQRAERASRSDASRATRAG